MVEDIRDVLEWGSVKLSGYQQVGCCGFASRAFDTRACFLLWLCSSRFRACCRFMFRLLRPGRPPCGGNYRLLWRLLDRLIRTTGICGTNGGLDAPPPLEDMVPPLTQIHLLGRGLGLRSFRSDSVICGGAILATLGRLLSKATLTSFRLIKTRNMAVWSVLELQRWECPGWHAIHQSCGAPHTRCTGERTRS